MEHQYTWSVDDRNIMTIWEDNCVIATIEECYRDLPDCFDSSLEGLFKEVVYEMRGIEL